MDPLDTKILKIVVILTICSAFPTALHTLLLSKFESIGGVFILLTSIYFILTTGFVSALFSSALWIKDTLEKKVIYSISTAVMVVPVYVYTLMIISIMARYS